MRLGTDIIEIERIQQALERNTAFADKILSGHELSLFTQMGDSRQIEFLAGRFAAKEAYAKALGTGIGKVKFTDITILPDEKGAPLITAAPIVDNVIVSISHSHHYATATVIMDLPELVVNAQLKEFLA